MRARQPNADADLTTTEWRRIDTNTTKIPQIDMEKFPHGGMLCLLGPYGDFFIDVLAEIVTTFPDVDAFSFDGLHYGGVCYCQHCRENFRKETGGEIPNTDLNDPAFRRYQHWADRRMVRLSSLILGMLGRPIISMNTSMSPDGATTVGRQSAVAGALSAWKALPAVRTHWAD